jgi:hypothetical protein
MTNYQSPAWSVRAITARSAATRTLAIASSSNVASTAAELPLRARIETIAWVVRVNQAHGHKDAGTHKSRQRRGISCKMLSSK